MKPHNIDVHFDASLDRITGRISLGAPPRVVSPTLKDFKIPDQEPTFNYDPEVDDHTINVRQGMWAIIIAEKGLESLKMARFLRRLTDEQRQTIYNDLFLGGVPFAWLMCVRPSVEDKVIAEITSMLAEPDKHNPNFYKKRRALERLLEDPNAGNADKRFQYRNNARYVRNDPKSKESEKNYRDLLTRDSEQAI